MFGNSWRIPIGHGEAEVLIGKKQVKRIERKMRALEDKLIGGEMGWGGDYVGGRGIDVDRSDHGTDPLASAFTAGGLCRLDPDVDPATYQTAAIAEWLTLYLAEHGPTHAEMVNMDWFGSGLEKWISWADVVRVAVELEFVPGAEPVRFEPFTTHPIPPPPPPRKWRLPDEHPLARPKIDVS